jgi:DNA-binding PadR family transcriptional regulator
MRRVFGHGGLRLFILMLLDESPRHGYDLIRLIEDRFMGMYTPSAGTVYPRLQSLEDEGLIEHEEAEGRKVYRLTDAGRRELDARRAELEDLQARATEAARKVAGMIGGEMRGTAKDLRDELRHAMKDVRREDRYASRRRAKAWDFGGETAAEGQGDARRGGLGWRVLRDDLDALRDDILDAARDLDLDRGVLGSIRERLMEAKDKVTEVLSGHRQSSQTDRTEV